MPINTEDQTAANPLDVSLEFLKKRTLLEFRRAHILQMESGELLNLDFNITAASDEDLMVKMREASQALGSDVLPAAPAEQWYRFAAIPWEQKRHLLIRRLAGRYRDVPGIVRIENAP